jgi:membrane-associated protease RseP (regulator of RpoE activity)
MREGYKRTATNNVILNNSLHPHVWYPNSGDVFKHNIVFGAYKPAVMARAIAPDGKWGAQLDSNLFATNNEDRIRFEKNGCDSNSLVGDALFVDTEKGDFRVEDKSLAIQVGFKNFPMNEFGVISEKLKKIAKQPVIPTLISSQRDKSGQIYQWYGATVKNVETLGEQSAAGLTEMSGVVLLNVPANSALSKSGLKVGDVILQCQDSKIQYFNQLLRIVKDSQYLSELNLVIQRNQIKKTIQFSLQ